MPNSIDEEPHNLPTGAATMSPAMADMEAYPRYLFDQVAPWLGSRVWEIGVGYGTYTKWLRESDKTVLATDIDPECVSRVAERFSADDKLTAGRVDLTEQRSVTAHRSFQADSVICFNVLEHIPDDAAALRWLQSAVLPGALLGLIVPAHPRLYGKMDVEAGHFRRYTRRSVMETLQAAGWMVQHSRYINAIGGLGWWYHNRWRKSAGLADNSVNSQMRAVDRWLPRFARVTDPIFGRVFGLSVVALARTADRNPEKLLNS